MSAGAWGDALPGQGEWIAVSGLRGPGSAIAATRLDHRTPGVTLVRGTLRDESSTLRIGLLEVRAAPELSVASGRVVTAVGRYENGVLHASVLADDVLAADPASCFGREVSRFMLEDYASAGDGRVRIGPSLEFPAPPAAGTFNVRRTVLEFERRPDGLLRATALNDAANSSSATQGGQASQPGSGRGGSSLGDLADPAAEALAAAGLVVAVSTVTAAGDQGVH